MCDGLAQPAELNCGAPQAEEEKASAPPWSSPKFDVKKKPPPVPKPRYLSAKPTVPSSSFVPRATVSEEEPGLKPERPRWGQLGESHCAKSIHDGIQEMTSSNDGKDRAGPVASVDAKSVPEDYKARWNRWRSMPLGFEAKLQQLMSSAKKQQEKPHAPSKEALDFLESLLSGTECEGSAQSKKVPIVSATAETTAKVVDNALRLKAQAETLRQKRGAPACGDSRKSQAMASTKQDQPFVQEQAVDSAQSSAFVNEAEFRHKSEFLEPSFGLHSWESKSRIENHKSNVAASRAFIPVDSHSVDQFSEADFEVRMRTKQEEHRKRILELEHDMQREQKMLLEEMARDEAEHSARRQAQDQWKNELLHDTKCRKQAAEQDARKKDDELTREEEAWRQRWWRNWQQSEERARQKVEEQKTWSKDWWEQWKEAAKDEADSPQEEEEPWASYRHRWSEKRSTAGVTDTPKTRPPPPPPRAAAKFDSMEQAQVLEQLCTYRHDSLEERKRTWRQLCLQWHPDKCDDKERATSMFQFLQGLKDWFLAEM